MSNIVSQLPKIVKESPIFVASKTFCPFCQATLKTLDSLKVKPYVLQLNQMKEGQEIQDALAKMTGQGTVPNIFIGGKHIGGNSDLQKLKKNGKLTELLSKF
ncbi:hypothetical protein DASC09_052450 [Saccharomycopsis crataegensis]|uniref:Glutaredoxin domain-containing protein n=1 Tax=Saccharomycopsis crataegensis TaxID=43959 RepID=A0AAV5QTJ3_9ASCO|nr:hypothetical protein DASC09_052450 [Saccharomycopsis crataegensis]